MAVVRSNQAHRIQRQRNSGFSLVELLVSMAIVGIVLGAIYAIFISQSRTASVQEQVVSTQKNLRAAMYFLEREVRMAGYNPLQTNGDEEDEDNDCDGTDDDEQVDDSGTDWLDESAAIGIKDAQTDTLTFTQDLNGDGDTCDVEESVTYKLNGMMLEKNGAPIAENIEAVYFDYLTATGADATDIETTRQVVITIVARTARPDSKFNDNNTYQGLYNTPVFSVPAGAENYRRQLLSTRVECRNLK